MQSIGCDEVFETLTRQIHQPAESGGDSVPEDHGIDSAIIDVDLAIAAHLKSCDECRSMAEALGPAVRLLRDSQSRGPIAEHDHESAAVSAIMRMVTEESNVRVSKLNSEYATEAEPNEAAASAAIIADSTETMDAPDWQFNPLVGLCCLAVAMMAMVLILQPNAHNGGTVMASDAERYDFLLNSGVPTVCLASVGWSHRELLQQTQAGGDTVPANDSKEENNIWESAGTDCCTACHNSAMSEDRPKDNPKGNPKYTPNKKAPENVIQPLANSCLVCHDAE